MRGRLPKSPERCLACPGSLPPGHAIGLVRRVADGLLIQLEQIVFATVEKAIKAGEISEAQKSHLTFFAFPLGAKRALDFCNFFEFGDKILFELKYQQANLFGEAQAATIENNLSILTIILNELAEKERSIEKRIMELKIK